MRELFRKILSPLLIMLFILVSIMIILKLYIGHDIEHFKQYLLPCSGRIITLSDTPTTISFCILDEEILSELASEENIESITLIDESGMAYQADTWNVSEAGFYQGTLCSAKDLNVTFSTAAGFHLKQIEIEYPDCHEVFDVGDVEIYLINNVDEYFASTQIWAYPLSLTSRSRNDAINLTYKQDIPSALYLDAWSSRDGFSIKDIDLGIAGLGINPNAVKFFEGKIDIGKSFYNDSSNAPFWLSNPVSVLNNSFFDIPIYAAPGSSDHLFIGLDHTIDFKAELNVQYYAPIYTCVDIKTGQEYLYADFGCKRKIPYIKDDNFAQQLLEEYGQ